MYAKKKSTFANLYHDEGFVKKRKSILDCRSKYSTSKKKIHVKLPVFGLLEMGCVRKRRKCWGLLSPTLWTSNFTVQANARHSWRSYFCFVSCRFWHLHEPNLPEERCASVVHWNPTGWGWNNVFCKHKYNSICEMKKTYLWVAFYSFIPLESLGTNMWLFFLFLDGSFHWWQMGPSSLWWLGFCQLDTN